MYFLYASPGDCEESDSTYNADANNQPCTSCMQALVIVRRVILHTMQMPKSLAHPINESDIPTYMYMLGTIKPPARFKAVRTDLKPSGPFQSRPDGSKFEAVGAIIYGFKAVWPAGFATGAGPRTVHVRIRANRGSA